MCANAVSHPIAKQKMENPIRDVESESIIQSILILCCYKCPDVVPGRVSPNASVVPN